MDMGGGNMLYYTNFFGGFRRMAFRALNERHLAGFRRY